MEFVRLIFVILFAVAGFTVVRGMTNPTGRSTVLGVILGSGTGFVLGGVFGRQTVTAVNAMEHEFGRVPAAELVAGAVGLLVELAIAALSSVPLFRLPPLAAWTTV
ncbi:MAG TPA: hypothetical protein VE173_11315, partial [Longimicrobiales bacterium]|nr:hypothetical protein [Longimicrobiales bacterium]